MLQRLPIPKKYLLAGGILLLCLICYQLAFKKTLEAWQTHKELNERLAGTDQLHYQPGYLQRKQRNLDNLLARYKADLLTFKNKSLTTIALIAARENVRLSEAPMQSVGLNTQNTLIQKITLQGDYFALTKTVSAIQTTNSVGMIRSVNFHLPKNNNSSSVEMGLFVDIYLEVVK